MEYVLRIVRWPRFTVDAIVRPLVLVLRHLHDHFIPHHRNNYHPHILGHRSLALFSALLVAVKIFTISLVSFGPVLPVFSSAITGENIISLTNESRKSFNLPALVSNQLLAKAAQAKANDMLAKGYFAHNSPDGKTPWDFIVSAGYSYLSAGENLAVNFVEAESVEAAWMNSPGHKANILNTKFVEIGVAAERGIWDGRNVWMAVQEFGLPLSACDSPTKNLLNTIENNKIDISLSRQRLDIMKYDIETSYKNDWEGYNNRINDYNILVIQYNILISATQGMIKVYNIQVSVFNDCLSEISN